MPNLVLKDFWRKCLISWALKLLHLSWEKENILSSRKASTFRTVGMEKYFGSIHFISKETTFELCWANALYLLVLHIKLFLRISIYLPFLGRCHFCKEWKSCFMRAYRPSVTIWCHIENLCLNRIFIKWQLANLSYQFWFNLRREQKNYLLFIICAWFWTDFSKKILI